jgi:hypothetical protein
MVEFALRPRAVVQSPDHSVGFEVPMVAHADFVAVTICSRERFLAGEAAVPRKRRIGIGKSSLGTVLPEKLSRVRVEADKLTKNLRGG